MPHGNLGKVIRLALIFLLILPIYFAWKWMVADFYGERVALSIDSWSSNNLINKITPETLNNHLGFILEAQKWAPENGRYRELEARVRLIRIAHLKRTEIQKELRIITELHRQALDFRPHWPFSWANLAYVKGLQRIYDKEFDVAVKNLMDYGPYELIALRRVSYVGIRGWHALSEESRNNMYVLIVNAAEIDRRLGRDLRKRLDTFGLRPEVCEQLSFKTPKAYDLICG